MTVKNTLKIKHDCDHFSVQSFHLLIQILEMKLKLKIILKVTLKLKLF